MARRYLGGERPAPRAADVAPLAEGWSETLDRYRAAIEGCRLHDALGEFARARRRAPTGPSTPSSPGSWPRPRRPATPAAGERLSGVLGDLIETCRLMALVVAPFMPTTAPRVLAQLGYAYPYAADGNGGPPLLDELVWGAHATGRGLLGEPVPLFPRLDVEAPTA